MPPGPAEDRSWVPGIVEKRLDAAETMLDTLAEWEASRERDAEFLPDQRDVEEALGIGWSELLELVREPQVSGDTRDWLVIVCEQAIDLWQYADLPRSHEHIVEALAFSVLDLDEAFFVPEDYDPEAEDDDPRGTYTVPWWITS